MCQLLLGKSFWLLLVLIRQDYVTANYINWKGIDSPSTGIVGAEKPYKDDFQRDNQKPSKTPNCVCAHTHTHNFTVIRLRAYFKSLIWKVAFNLIPFKVASWLIYAKHCVKCLKVLAFSYCDSLVPQDSTDIGGSLPSIRVWASQSCTVGVYYREPFLVSVTQGSLRIVCKYNT